MQAYKTLMGIGNEEYIIQKSRFIARAQAVTSQKEVQAFLNEEKAKYPYATHHCYAYILNADGNTARFWDDNEPSGTAGMPILSVLRKQNLTECMVVVTRYFGGILLGAGGLARAYGHSASLAVNAAGIGLMLQSREYICILDYSYNDRLQHYLKDPLTSYIKTLGIDYAENVTYQLVVKLQEEQKFIRELSDMLDNRIILKPQDITYRLWENPVK